MLLDNITKLENILNLSGGQFVSARMINLPLQIAAPADGTGGSEAPGIAMVTTTDVTDPQIRTYVFQFDDSTNEQCYWQFALPSNYSTKGRLVIQYYMESTQASSAIRWEASILALTPAVDADDMEGLDATNSGGGWVAKVEGFTGYSGNKIWSSTINLESYLDSMSAGDIILLSLRRNAAHEDDTAGGDATLLNVIFEYNY